jgi:hypothetical protein
MTGPRRRTGALGGLAAFALLALALTALIGAAGASAHHGPPHGWHPPHHPGHPGGPTLPGAGEAVPGVADASDPTALRPPAIDVLTNDPGTAPGDIFIAPKPGPLGGGTIDQQGPEIVDDQGRPFFFQPIAAPYTATDFRVQTLYGQPVLTYNVGQSTGGPGHSDGIDVILNQHYQEIATVKAGNGLMADQHEFRITPWNTALITIYKQVPEDLSAYGGSADGSVYEGVVQEIDIATGKVLFEWDSLDHVPLSDSRQPVPTDPNTPWDYFHINSVNPDTDGNLLISARHTWTIYKVDRGSGNVIWRLGGKESDFQIGPGATFAWQHNALPETGQPDTIRIFDNGSSLTGPGTPDEPQSRVLDIHLDLATKTATLVGEVTHPDGLSAGSQGNAQRLDDGHLFVGWGQLGRFSEFDSDGNLIWDGQVPAGYDTYRAYRSEWTGEPLTDPTAVAAASGGDLSVSAYWNGATEVARWVALAGRDPRHLRPVGSATWDGLDTVVDAHCIGARYVAVVALDARGHAIGTSPTVPVTG